MAWRKVPPLDWMRMTAQVSALAGQLALPETSIKRLRLLWEPCVIGRKRVESDARTHRTPKHFVQNPQKRLLLFAPALGVRTRPRVAFERALPVCT